MQAKENYSPKLIKEVLFMGYYRNQFTECLQKPMAYNFCKRISWSEAATRGIL